ncbi:MAG TPA: SDR family oxidoreductase [Limnobacter sp.]|nr:SDR family oxidoreductase [Limnobacter sp.]
MTTLAAQLNMKERLVMITGGAGHLGYEMARTVAELGASVVLVDINYDQAMTRAQAVQTEFGVRCWGMACNLELEEERKHLPARVAEEAGSLDVLINNAGFVGDSTLKGWVCEFSAQSIETWRRALEVNLTACFHLSQLFRDQLARNQNGSIVNVSSIYGVLGPDMSLYDGTAMGNPAAYAASKGGLVQLTRWLSTVLAPQIRVNCISPGGLARGQNPLFSDRYINKTPLKRMGEEQDFKGVTALLASDASRWMTGQNLMVDGGWTAW